MKKGKPNPKANRNIMMFLYGIVILFLCMCVYFGYFIQVESEDLINNSYNNARLNLFESRVVRGPSDSISEVIPLVWYISQ